MTKTRRSKSFPADGESSSSTEDSVEEFEENEEASKDDSPFQDAQGWGETIEEYFAGGTTDMDKFGGQQVYSVFRDHKNGSQLADSKGDKNTVSLLEEYLDTIPKDTNKLSWIAVKCLELARKNNRKRRKNTQPQSDAAAVASSSTSKTPSLPPFNVRPADGGSEGSLSSTTADVVAMLAEPTPSSKRAKLDLVPMRVGNDLPKSFKIVGHKKFKMKNDTSVSNFPVTHGFQYDNDSYIYLVKKSWGKGPKATSKFYIRHARNYVRRATKQEEVYSYDYPLDVHFILIDQYKHLFEAFEKTNPGVIEKARQKMSEED